MVEIRKAQMLATREARKGKFGVEDVNKLTGEQSS
jgi:hypothetical protein